MEHNMIQILTPHLEPQLQPSQSWTAQLQTLKQADAASASSPPLQGGQRDPRQAASGSGVPTRNIAQNFCQKQNCPEITNLNS